MELRIRAICVGRRRGVGKGRHGEGTELTGGRGGKVRVLSWQGKGSEGEDTGLAGEGRQGRELMMKAVGWQRKAW